MSKKFSIETKYTLYLCNTYDEGGSFFILEKDFQSLYPSWKRREINTSMIELISSRTIKSKLFSFSCENYMEFRFDNYGEKYSFIIIKNDLLEENFKILRPEIKKIFYGKNE